MNTANKLQPYWVSRGKTIRDLVAELQACANQDLEVRVAIGAGAPHKALGQVAVRGGLCLLIHSE